MPPSNNWHDVNDPGFYRKPQAQNTQTREQPAQEVAPAADTSSEVRLSQGKFIIPTGGAQFNKKVKAQVSVEYLKETPRKRVTFKLFSRYKGETADMRSSVDATEQDGTATGEFTLHYNEAYYDDEERAPDATVDYTFKASHPKGEAVIESEVLTLPSKGRQVVLSMTLPEGMSMDTLGKDTFVLFSTDSAKTYSRSCPGSGFESKGSGVYEVVFPGVPEDLSYTLEIQISPDGIKYPLISEVAFAQLGEG